MDPTKDNRLTWIKSTGAAQTHGAQLAVGTYYAVIPKGRAHSFGGTFVTDAALVATATVEGNDIPTVADSDFAAAGTSGWTDEPDVDDVVMNATEGATSLGHVVEFERRRARVKLVVTTPGVCTLYITVQDN